MADNLGQLFLNLALENPAIVKALKGGPKNKNAAFPSAGDIIRFKYQYASAGSDANPLVLITDPLYKIPTSPLFYVRGINLHYLQMDQIRLLMGTRINACNNPTFSYNNIKPYKYIKQAFRMYKKAGIKNVQIVNCEYLKRLLGASRKLEKQDLDAIKDFINQQLRKEINPKAKDIIGRQ